MGKIGMLIVLLGLSACSGATRVSADRQVFFIAADATESATAQAAIGVAALPDE